MKVSIATTLKEGFVVGARSMPGNHYDGHTLAETLEQAAIMADSRIDTVIVDRGYVGVQVQGVRILRSGHKRNLTRRLKATIGDAIHAVLCGFFTPACAT